MLYIDQNMCTGCGACYNCCPNHCIEMQENDEGFLYPVVDIKRCINCNVCNDVCPLEKECNVQGDAYCVTSKTPVSRQSSSAGIASLLSKEIVKDGGVVFGAAFDDTYTLVHKKIATIEEVDCVAGSKYVQSNIGTTFKEVENVLKEGQTVVFIGTPCQIAGLDSFLGKKYNNLYMIDFICHGVPSPKVWKYYLYHIKENNRLGDIESVNFRDKKYGWANYGLSIKGVETEYFSLKNDDLYEKAFIRNITLRKSCFFCKFKGNNRRSDITLGDFWGGREYSSVYSSDGTSIVVVHTQQGEKLFDKMAGSINAEKIELYDYARKHNGSLLFSVKPNWIRKRFFDKFVKSPEKIAVQLEKHIRKTNLAYMIVSYRSKMIWIMNKVLCMLKLSKSMNKGA